ncbi:hypothetical protein [uncultured Campylobacter sp.]|uniref:hypothetical protein n=1 Tax=uncultured Campylobacter sp. TaxID=218934 RepID=UPI0026277007|nr:hypothetical protein [uncultured Campylobacter sp.]
MKSIGRFGGIHGAFKNGMKFTARRVNLAAPHKFKTALRRKILNSALKFCAVCLRLKFDEKF